MTSPLITDSATGQTSNSKLWFSIISAVVIVKFALAGITIGDFSFGAEFDETGAATLIAAFGGVYGWRASTKGKGNGT